MINEERLAVFGLSAKEAKVYLALLELGPSTMTEVARVANINRTTGYPVLETLAAKGLVYFINEAKIQKYTPTMSVPFWIGKIESVDGFFLGETEEDPSTRSLV